MRGEGATTQPWMTNFSSIVVNEDIRNSDRPDKFSIFKPHGCVQSMICAQEAAENGDLDLAGKISDRFMIGEQELSEIRENQTDRQFTTRLQNSLYTSPTLIVGWSVSEPYLKELVNDAMAQQINKKKVQELSVVDINFGTGHKKVAEKYDLSKDDVFFEVGKNIGVDDANQFFLWLQAKFTLERLEEYASSPTTSSVIAQYNARTKLDSYSLLNWADTFLPAWCLLCWRGDVVPCAGFRPEELEIDKPDNYIPISHPAGNRMQFGRGGWLTKCAAN